jgi:uncharacterized protein YbjT (DUF2867 family)
MTILVTGATGNVGVHVVRELVERGLRVRAFVRDPARAAALLGDDVELAVGDYADPASVRRALDGVERPFLACSNIPRQTEYEIGAIHVAKATGVERIVKLSFSSAALDSPLLYPRWHAHIERHLRRSGVPAVLIAPGFLMHVLLRSAEAIAQTGKLFAPADGARIAMIHPRDVATVAAMALTEDGHEGNRYVLTGERPITYDDVARDLSEATGRPIDFVDVSDEAARDGLLAAGTPPVLADFVVQLFGMLRAGLGEKTTGTFRALTGAEPRAFAEFAREHAAAFGADRVLT